MSEFAGGGTTASTEPTALSPGDPQAVATKTQPAVMVEEKTVPMRQARAGAPMEIAPPAAQLANAEPPAQPGPEPSAVNLNQPPAQPEGKLLTPEEKAKVIAELEALAKKQSAELKANKDAACAADNLKPAQRVVSATGDGGC